MHAVATSNIIALHTARACRPPLLRLASFMIA
jgi:hypothetical protein